MRQQLTTHPIRSLGVLLVLAFGFFMLSASGQSGTFWENGPGWLGTIGWFAFLLTALAFLVAAGYVAVHSARRRRTA
ncbi:MAG TPA: hypothetical protein VGK78_06415 [Nocardioides sp.]|uniref:hypothetical protein n=1 Tax=Nocardioides sp. TaxID=35761 RepID=UPI002F415B2B